MASTRLDAGFGFRAQAVQLDVAQHGGLDSRKREEEVRVEARNGRCLCGLGARGVAAEVNLCLDLREGEGDGLRVAEFREGIDPGAAGITEAEKFGHFVEGFAGGVVDGAADESVRPSAVCWAREKEVGVAAGDDEGEGLVMIKIRALPGPGMRGTGGTLRCVACSFALLRRTAWMWPSR